ncbi:MAG: FIST N-terminal domain-containing protein [Pseudomonadota bacterium]
MKIIVKEADGIEGLLDQLAGSRFDFMSLHGNCEIDVGPLSEHDIAKHVHGATSCLGAMSNAGPTKGIAAFAIEDSAGAYGSALVAFNDSPQDAAAEATRKALLAADRLGERPDLVWVSSTPGVEEDILAGIEGVIGTDTPIIGGSAADNSVAGGWFVFNGAVRAGAGVVVSVLFPSTPVSFAYQSGYSPTEKSGIVTKCDGRRLLELDGRPALEVYSEWTGGTVANIDKPEDSRAILSESTMWPLGREISQVGEVPFFLLAHPAVGDGTGAIDLFANVAEGERLTLMTGTQHSLIERAGRVAALAHATAPGPDREVAGALMIYCGGCMLSVQDRLSDVAAGVNTALDGAPFLGAFTFGEQGALLKAGNRHGNLMISCVVFG